MTASAAWELLRARDLNKKRQVSKALGGLTVHSNSASGVPAIDSPASMQVRTLAASKVRTLAASNQEDQEHASTSRQADAGQHQQSTTSTDQLQTACARLVQQLRAPTASERIQAIQALKVRPCFMVPTTKRLLLRTGPYESCSATTCHVSRLPQTPLVCN